MKRRKGEENERYEGDCKREITYKYLKENGVFVLQEGGMIYGLLKCRKHLEFSFALGCTARKLKDRDLQSDISFVTGEQRQKQRILVIFLCCYCLPSSFCYYLNAKFLRREILQHFFFFFKTKNIFNEIVLKIYFQKYVSQILFLQDKKKLFFLFMFIIKNIL